MSDHEKRLQKLTDDSLRLAERWQYIALFFAMVAILPTIAAWVAWLAFDSMTAVGWCVAATLGSIGLSAVAARVHDHYWREYKCASRNLR